MINSVIDAVEKYGMLDKAKEVTVALSGGADSVALLNVLLELSGRYGIRVHAAHLNHKLRGAESDRDELFVREICKAKQVELTVKSADIRGEAESTGESVELAARRARYAFFEQCGGIIATAHTADDNLETVLFNLIRGTGPDGLCGIPPVRGKIIRPLIFCTRNQVEEYCRERGLSFVTDSSNLTDDYTRNKLRHNAIPVLKQINPAAAQSTVRACALLREENRFLHKLATGTLRGLKKGDTLDVRAAKDLDPALLRRVLRELAAGVTGEAPDSFHTEQLCRLIQQQEGRWQLPGGFNAEVCRGKLRILPINENNCEYSVETETISKEEYIKRQKINNLLSKNALDYDKIIGSIVIRKRMPGDTIKLKSRSTKTLKKLYNEMMIPHDCRENLPVAADNNGVVWVCTAGVAQRAAVDGNTSKILLIISEKKQ